VLAFVLAAAVVAASPEVRTFWRPEEVPRPQPVQGRVTAELVGEGRHLIVYRERGYRFSTIGDADEASQVEEAIRAFDEVIHPRLVGAFGPCPDVDGNGKVILLLTRSTRDDNPFLRFDLLPDAEALASGMHSNEAEILYLSFGLQGNRSTANLADLARAFHLLLHASRDAAEVGWSELLANYSAVLCGFEDRRALWGESSHLRSSPSPADSWTARGWELLFVEYLRERLGERLLTELVGRQEVGQAGLDAALAVVLPGTIAGELAADFAMACWLDDQRIGGGRFAFAALTPPRPPLAARVPASRPTSGQLSCGVGGTVHMLIDGDGESPQPLVLRADPRVRWFGRAVHLRRRGPDEELELRFDEQGLARLELPLLPRADGVIISVTAEPPAIADFDPRILSVLWGLGWVPRELPAEGFAALQPLAERILGSAMRTTLDRIAGSLDRLGGLAPPGDQQAPLATRYAWAPEASRVVALLEREGQARGLTLQPQVFLRTAPPDIRQDWRNLVHEVPGVDERRWPVVIAAHWDAARASLPGSYARALGLDENASGVVTLLEAAHLLAGARPRSPIVLALLAGGNHGAAGAGALLESLSGQAAAWIELDGVGVPAAGARQLEVLVEGGTERDPLTNAVASALGRVGLTPVLQRDAASPHTGAALAGAKGIPALVLRTRDATSAAADAEVPAAVERERLSEELIGLIARAVAQTATTLAGSSPTR